MGHSITPQISRTPIIGAVIRKNGGDGNQTVNNNSEDLVTLPTVTRDDGTLTATANRITVPSGWWTVSASVYWEKNTDGHWDITIYHYNVSNVLQTALTTNRRTPSSDYAWLMHVSGTVYAATGDYFLLKVYQKTGGSKIVYGQDGGYTELSAARIGQP